MSQIMMDFSDNEVIASVIGLLETVANNSYDGAIMVAQSKIILTLFRQNAQLSQDNKKSIVKLLTTMGSQGMDLTTYIHDSDIYSFIEPLKGEKKVTKLE